MLPSVAKPKPICLIVLMNGLGQYEAIMKEGTILGANKLQMVSCGWNIDPSFTS